MTRVIKKQRGSGSTGADRNLSLNEVEEEEEEHEVDVSVVLGRSVLLQLLGSIVSNELESSSSHSGMDPTSDDSHADSVLEAMKMSTKSENSLSFSCKLVT